MLRLHAKPYASGGLYSINRFFELKSARERKIKEGIIIILKLKNGYSRINEIIVRGMS